MAGRPLKKSLPSGLHAYIKKTPYILKHKIMSNSDIPVILTKLEQPTF